MSFTVFTNNVYPALASIIKSLIDEGHSVTLFSAEKLNASLVDHQCTLPILERCSKLELQSFSEIPDANLDRLLFSWNHAAPYTADSLRKLLELVNQSKEVTALYDANFGSNWDIIVQQTRDFFRNYQLMSKVKHCCYVTIRPSINLLTPWANNFCFNVGPSQECLFDDKVEKSLYCGYEIEKKRAYRVFASGDKTSSLWREELTTLLEENLKQQSHTRIKKVPTDNIDLNCINILWLLNPKKKRISNLTYTNILKKTDFVLCVPGTSWTHRPFEAAVSGAIPILESYLLPFYEIPFADGENCLLIKSENNKANWIEVLNRALSMDEFEILKMRKNLYNLGNKYLDLNKYKQKLTNKIIG